MPEIAARMIAELFGHADPPEPATDLPPTGSVWFGESFDTETFEIRNRMTAVGANEPFSLVAHFPRVVNAEEFAIRLYLDGQLVSSSASNATGSGDLWGYSPGPLFEPGVWRYEFTDIGGNVLASGEITAE
jgi:hypothetical protein